MRRTWRTVFAGVPVLCLVVTTWCETNEFEAIPLLNGGSIYGAVVTSTPARVTIRTSDGMIEMDAYDLADSEIMKLPKNISYPYRETARMQGVISNEISALRNDMREDRERIERAMELIKVAKDAPERTWREVRKWEGSSTKRTEMFAIKGKEWRIRWSSFGDSLTAIVYRPDSTPASVISGSGVASDLSYVYEAGTFYIEIISMGRYSLVVEEIF